MSKLTALQYLGAGFETAYGTGAPATTWFPVNSVKYEDVMKKIEDDARRNNLSKVFAVYQSVTNSTLDLETNLYLDNFGVLLKGIMGQDVVSGTAPNYTHTFKLVNAMAPSMTMQYYNSIAQHQLPGCGIQEVGIKIDTENLVTVSAKFLGMQSTVVTTATPTFTTMSAVPGWQTALTIGGTSNTNLVGADLTIKRDVKLLYGANNSQAPSKFSTGRVEVTGKLTFDVESETELNLLSGADNAIVLTLSQGANDQMIFTCSQADYKKAAIDTSQEFARVDVEFTGVYNTTDAGPCNIVLKNQVASY